MAGGRTVDFSTWRTVTRSRDATLHSAKQRRPVRSVLVAQAVLWLAGALCAGMALIVVWLELHGQHLDAQMDLVNAARGGS